MRYEIDATDAGVLAIYLASVLSIVNIMSVELFTLTASDELFTVANGSVSLSIAGVAAIATFVWVYMTNEQAEIPSLDDEYGYLVVASAAVTAGLVFLPDFATWVAQQNDLVSLALPVVSTAGVAVIGYLK